MNSNDLTNLTNEPTYLPLTEETRAAVKYFPRPCYYTPGKFCQTFRSPFEQYAHRIGQPFQVVRELTDDEKNLDDNSEPMYLIRFTDGGEIVAWGEEVCE